MNKQQLREHLKTVCYNAAGEATEEWLDETMQLIDQYAYEYAERVIGPGMPSFQRDELRREQHKLNKELSSHGEAE